MQKRQKALDTDCSFNHDADRRVPLAEWTCKSTQDGTLRALTPEELEILSYGSLTKYEIEAEIRNKLSGIKNCFEDLIKKPGPDKNPDRHKAVRYISQFRIEKDGKVVEATGDFKLDPDNSLLSMPETIASKECFNGIARTYQFPPPRGGGIVQVKYPFVINFAPPKSKQKL